MDKFQAACDSIQNSLGSNLVAAYSFGFDEPSLLVLVSDLSAVHWKNLKSDLRTRGLPVRILSLAEWNNWRDSLALEAVAVKMSAKRFCGESLVEQTILDSKAVEFLVKAKARALLWRFRGDFLSKSRSEQNQLLSSGLAELNPVLQGLLFLRSDSGMRFSDEVFKTEFVYQMKNRLSKSLESKESTDKKLEVFHGFLEELVGIIDSMSDSGVSENPKKKPE